MKQGEFTKLDQVLDELLGYLRRQTESPSSSRGNVGAPVVAMPEGPSMTKQAFAEESDINVIMSRYENSGVVPRMNARSPQWGDFSQVGDYHTACQRVVEAQQLFDALPAAVRAEFENDPEQLIAALDDPARRADLERLGLIEPKVIEAVKAELTQTEIPGAQAPEKDTPNT